MRNDADHRAQQRMLGVGVPIQRRPSAHLKHLNRIRAHAEALVSGFTDPEHQQPQRLALLRQRLGASPFYSAWLLRHGASPNDLQTVADLAHLPPMHRDRLGSSWGEAAALGIDPETEVDLAISTSSGSTGKAIPVLRDGYDQLHMWAAIRFWVARFQVSLPPRPRLAFVCTLPGGLEYSTRLPHLDGGALHRISSLRADAIDRLERVRPALLSSDPAGFHWLLGRELSIAPRLLLSSAQHLSPAQRLLIGERFPAPLINVYATTETGPIAWECCAEGTFHVLQPDVFVESVAGELVVTRLRDSVLPLLRYQTGDRGTVTEGSCSCGFRGRSIGGFLGRRACNFIRPDGEPVDAWNLIWLFKDLPLVGFCMEQVAADAFVVSVDGPLPMPEELLTQRLALALVRLGWSAPTIAIRREATLQQVAKPEPFLCSLNVRSSRAPGGAS